jgi:hypothetical protein
LPEPLVVKQKVMLSRLGAPPPLAEISIKIKRTETVGELKSRVARRSDIDASMLCVMHLTRHKQCIEVLDKTIVETVVGQDPLWVFELDLPRTEAVVVPVVHRRHKRGAWRRNWEPVGSVQCFAMPASDLTNANARAKVAALALSFLPGAEQEKMLHLTDLAGSAEVEQAIAAASNGKARGNE